MNMNLRCTQFGLWLAWSLLAWTESVVGQAPTFDWARQAGTSGYNSGTAIGTDNAGFCYVTGFFQGTASFGTTNLVSRGGNDIFVAAYDPAGNLAWVRQAGGSDYDTGLGLAVDGEGNVLVTGTVSSLDGFGVGSLTNTGAFVAKYSGQGQLLWVRSISGGYRIATDPAGNVYVTDGSVTKLDRDGNRLWSVPTGVVASRGIAVDSAGNSYITGWIEAGANFGTTNLTVSGNQDACVAKYDSGGNFMWVHQMGGVEEDRGIGIASDALGNVYATGRFTGTASFGGTNLADGGTNLTALGEDDIFLARLDSTGRLVWARRAGGLYSDSGVGVAVDEQGSVFLTGNFNHVGTFGAASLSSSGSYEVFITKWNGAGSVLWRVRAGGNGPDGGQGIAVHPSGKVFVTGSFSGNAGGDASFGATNLVFAFDQEGIFVTRLTDIGRSQPYVAIQPQSVVVALGSNATLAVTADGAPPLFYQWFRLGVPLVDATNTTFTFNAQAATVGGYTVVVSNTFGVVTSQVATVTLGQPGSLDFGFAADVGEVRAIMLQPDGKILVGGNFAVARLNEDGAPDPSFTPAAGSIHAMAMQPDGKVVVGGSFTTLNDEPRNHIARLNADGSLDTGFDPGVGADQPVYTVKLLPGGDLLIGGSFSSYDGTPRSRAARIHFDGTLDTGFVPAEFESSLGPANVEVFDMVPLADGKIIVGGEFHTVGGQPRRYLARLLANGAVDPSFAPDTRLSGHVFAIARQRDGKLVLGGDVSSELGHVVRVNADGSWDGTFTPNVTYFQYVRALALQPDEEIVAGGSFRFVNQVSRKGIARLDANGTLDTGFSPGSGVTGGIQPDVQAIAIQPDGKVLIGGSFTAFNGVPRTNLARLYGGETNNSPPVITVTNPTPGAVFTAPVDVVLAARVVDSDGEVRRVDFYEGTNLLLTLTNLPYTYTASNLSPGSYSYLVRAVDNQGTESVPVPINFTVRTLAVSLTSPTNGTRLTARATVNLGAQAGSPDDVISRVDFSATGSAIGTNVWIGSVTNSLSGTNAFPFAWSNIAVGAYQVRAKATDNFGASSTSAPVSIEIVQPFFLAQNGSGTASASPARSSYQVGESVTLTATPRNTNWTRFLNWSDGNTNATRTITVGASNVFTAVFTNFVALEEQVLQQWETIISGLGTAGAYSISEAAGGGYFVGGYSAVFGGGGITSTNHGGNDYWVMRLDAGGQKLWDRSFGGTGSDILLTLVATTDGGCLLGGSSSSPVSGNKTSPWFGSSDFWVIRLNQNGDELWQRSYGDNRSENLQSAALTSDGGFILGGVVFTEETDFRLMRVDRDGSVVWERTFGGTGHDNLQVVRQTADGGFVAGGDSASPPGGSKTSPLYGSEDAWVVRLDANGNKLWDKSYGGADSDALTSLSEMADGGFLLNGATLSANTPPGNRVAPLFGNVDVWAIRTDAQGSWLYDATYGGSGPEIADSVAPLPDGGFMISGASQTSSLGGNKTGTNYGSNDGFLARFSADGTKLWDHSFGGTGSEIPKEMVRTGGGGFVLAGYTEAGGGGTKATTNAGVWVVKFLTREVAAGTPALTVNGQSSFSNQFVVNQTNSARIELSSSFPNGFIFYTLDGLEPDPGSELYAGPFTVSNSVVVRAVAVDQFFNLPGVTNEAVTVTIVASYDLLTSTPGGGTVMRNPSASRYPSNSVVTLTASPLPGWTFLSWTGDANGTSAVTLVAMDGLRFVQAVFGTPLTVINSGPGIVLRSPALDAHPYGTVVRLSAVPDAGKFFSSWSGAHSGGISPLEFTVTNANPSVTASFPNLPANRFALTALINGEGEVTKNPQSAFYTSGASVTLTATARPGSFFSGWTGDASVMANPLPVTMTTSKLVTAIFTLIPPNQPPTVTLNLPANGAAFVAPADIALSATANDADGSVLSVGFFANSSPVGLATNTPFNSTWSGASVGSYVLKAVATDNGGLSATSAPVTVTVSFFGGPAAFRFEQAAYPVGEGDGVVTLRVIRNFGGFATVNYNTGDGSANAGADYNATAGQLVFQSGETFKTIPVTILEDFVVEGSHTFSVSLSAPSSGGLASPAVAVVTILDNDTQTGSSFLSVKPVVPVNPNALGSLRVFLTGDASLGQWRLPWERSWRAGGAAAAGLQPGLYEIEFKPLPGYLVPPPVTLAVSAAQESRSTNGYTFLVNTPAGSLTVFIDPSEVAANPDPGCRGQWSVPGHPFMDSGATLAGLPAGSYTVTFKGLNGGCGWGTPATREATVRPGVSNSFRASYVTNFAGPSLPAALAFANDILPVFDNSLPYTYCGQITTEFGEASGVVVKERVVLTAAHVVFDDYSLSWVGNAQWFFQRHAPDYNPAPQQVRGYYVNDGYAARRQAEGTPGVSQAASFDLDVAALYFYEAAGRGGYGGYLVSDAGTQWLQTNSHAPLTLRALVGYPVEGIAPSGLGKMHAIGPTSMSFDQTTGTVFTCSTMRGLPGNSGGPLCVQWSDGRYFPAGVYVGGSDRAIVRAIDSRAVEVINQAELTSNLGTNQTGGGVIRFGVAVPAGTCYEFATVTLEPASALAAGAQWRVHYKATGLSPWTNSSSYHIVLNNKPDFLELAEAEGFLTPDPSNFTLGCVATNLVFTYFQLLPRLDPLGAHLVLSGVTNRTYRIELNGRIGTTSGWTPLTNISFPANNSVAILSNALTPVATNRFLRAVRVP